MTRLRLPISSGLALFALAFSLVSVQAFLRAAPIGPGIGGELPAVSVNHFRKGDRLPQSGPAAASRQLLAPEGLRRQKKVPLGCDPAFGPGSSPSSAKVYGRCMA